MIEQEKSAWIGMTHILSLKKCIETWFPERFPLEG